MIAARKVAETLGGKPVLGRNISNFAELDAVVRRGLPFAAVKHMIDLEKMSVGEAKRYVVPSSTYARRAKSARLSVAESERTERLARVFATAEEVFLDEAKAYRWMRAANRELGGRTPLDAAASELGARQIETMLWQIAHGIAA